jgi:chromosome segregation ATPase
MVQTDVSQLSRECNGWRETLRSNRDELTLFKRQLQHAASHQLSRDQLQDVEHYHNQFHIQLINIHDLKQAVKSHDRKVNFEMTSNNGQVNEGTVSEHENIFDQYTGLQNTLQDLRQDFNRFMEKFQLTV